MADNTAHTPAGPESHPTDLGVSAASPADVASEVLATDNPVANVASHTEAIADDVELVGRASAPVARLGEDEPAAVLVGAGSVGRTDDARLTGTTGKSSVDLPTSGSAATKSGGDLPVWSFGSVLGRPEPEPATAAARDQAELPFKRVGETNAAAPRPQPLFGPVGRQRSAMLVPLLAAVTLGAYAVVWHRRINRELEEFDPKLHSRPVRSAVAVAVPWLLGLLTTVAGAVLIVGARFGVHVPFDSHVSTTQAYYLLAGLAAVPYLMLVVPFSLVAIVMTIERLRCVEEHLGTTTDRQVRPVGSCLLMAIPLAGSLMLLGVEQRRLNAIWDAVAPAGRISR
jgi:hypothetical protein